MHYSSDESIPEDDAFNSEDEAKYGRFFQGKPYSCSGGKTNCVQLLAVEVSAPKTQGDADVVTVEVIEGTKAVLSNACLDCLESPHLRLMFRCMNEDDGQNDMPWMCLSHFGSSSSASLNNLEVVGPSVIEFKILLEALSSWNKKNAETTINIFGQIIPTDAISGGVVYINKNTHVEGNMILKESTDMKTSTTNKRKLSHEIVEESTLGVATANTKSPDDASKNCNKLTKKQRKELAEEKSKQLEDALSSAREIKSETKSKKKKKKKQTITSEDEPPSKPTSLTHERRLPGGILISDILIGTGTKVSSGRKISLHYTGKLTNGKVFDKNHSRTQPLQFRQALEKSFEVWSVDWRE